MRTTTPRTWRHRAVAIGAILIAATVGLCVFDGDAAGHDDLERDLCLAMVGVVEIFMLVVMFHVIGELPSVGPWRPTTVAIAVLDPPPRPSPSV
jgi:hypothetical protein